MIVDDLFDNAKKEKGKRNKHTKNQTLMNGWTAAVWTQDMERRGVMIMYLYNNKREMEEKQTHEELNTWHQG